MSLELDRRGIERLTAELEGFADRADDVRPAFEAVADDFRELMLSRFSGGASWAPVSPEWAARKSREGRPRRPLVYRGGFEASFTREGARYHRERIGRDSLEVVSRSPLVNLVAGNPPGRGHAKRRELVELTRADERRWASIVRRHVIDGERV